MDEFLVIFDTHDGAHGLERWFEAVDADEAIRKCIEMYPESKNHSAVPYASVTVLRRRPTNSQ